MMPTQVRHRQFALQIGERQSFAFGSEIAVDAGGAEVVDEGADGEEGAAGGAAGGIEPDAGFTVEEGGGVDSGVAAGEGDAPVELVFGGVREGPSELAFVEGELVGQGEFPEC